MTLVSCWLHVSLLIFHLFWILLNISFVWYNAYLFDWPLFALLVCLEDALVQPFMVCCPLLFLIKIPWGRSLLIIFIGHSIPFVCDYNWVLLMMFVCLSCDLSWAYIVLLLSNAWVIYMIGISCHFIITWGFWYLISMLPPHFCLTWCLFPFRGMFRFHHVHLLLPSLSVVWYDTLVMSLGLSFVNAMYNILTSLVYFPCARLSLLRLVDFSCWLEECLLTWMLMPLNSILVLTLDMPWRHV